ncbi:MAG: protein kinase, partial [Candidatus Eisenbacteria bacterium]|nr:protein kinase [Candidatus Eisenbacteria bacterium]
MTEGNPPRESGPDAATIFADALELPTEARASYLDRVCGADSALKSEVVSLLQAHESARHALDDRAIEAEIHQTARGLESGVIGLQVGTYRIVRLIATGGMGAVYLGERSDDEYSARVAIKLFRATAGGDALLARFRTERQVLADLRHPHIARLIDGGATDDGLPYIIMEYIDGEPLDAYADRHKLTIRERLQLFRGVCEAVTHAHQNLIVHRDLKPPNILVDQTGAPKLLDFGIAKILGDEAGMDQTATHMRMLTPRYASPEQIRGEPVTTATDVYSLGVILYELLTGKHPHATGAESEWRIDRSIVEADPTRPSEAVTALAGGATQTHPVAENRGTDLRSLGRRLRGDLDTILLKALEKEPTRRYTSVAELSEDLRRHLEGLTVLARPETIRYRTTKFARRNKVLVGAVAAVLLALVVGLVATRSQYERADRERTRAEQQTTEARWLAYTAKVAAAEGAIRSNQIEDAARFLDEAPEDLRGWEWDHLYGRLDHSLEQVVAHDTWVTALAFSPDGQTLASASYDQTVKFWDLHPLRLRRTLRREFTPAPNSEPWLYGAMSLDFHPDGRLLAVGYVDMVVDSLALGVRKDAIWGTTTIWDVVSGTPVGTTGETARGWTEVDFDPNGDRLAVSDRYKTFVFDRLASRLLLEVEPRNGEQERRVQDVCFDPKRPRFYTARTDIETWDTRTGTQLETFPTQGDEPLQLIMDPRGERLAAVMRSGTVAVWDAERRTPVTSFRGHQGVVHDAVFDSSGAEIMSVGDDGRVLAWDSETGATRAVLRGHRCAVRSIALASDDQTLATGDERGVIRIWNRSIEDVQTFHIPQDWRPQWATDAIPTRDGARIVTASTIKEVHLWKRSAWTDNDKTSGTRLDELDACGARKLALSPTDDTLLVANDSGFVTISDLSARKLLYLFRAHDDSVSDLDFAPDGSCFVTVGEDSVVSRWRLAEAAPVRIASSKVGAILTAVRFTLDGTRIVCGDAEGRIFVRNGVTCEEEVVIPAHNGPITGLAMAPDGSYFASSSTDGSVKLWNLPDGSPGFVLVQGEAAMDEVAISADGTRLFTGGDGGEIRVLDPRRGEEIVRLSGHRAAIRSLRTGADGVLVSASRDGTVKLWEAGSPSVAVGNPDGTARRDSTVESDARSGGWWNADGDARDHLGRTDGLLQNG